MRFWRLFLVVLMCSACAAAQDMDKQARDEAAKAFRGKKIDAASYSGFISKINNGKSEEVLKELGAISNVSSAPLYSDWPQWLGPNRDGSSPETGLLREWPEEGPKILWMKPITKGWGSASIYEGQVFLSGNDYKGKYYVHCLDAFTGAEVWKYEYLIGHALAKTAWGYCPRDTVTATEKYVYSINDQGQLFCLDRKNGNKVWLRDLDTEYTPAHVEWKGWCMSPLIEDNIIFQALPDKEYKKDDEAVFVGIDADTGKNVWEHREKRTSNKRGPTINHSTASVVTFGDDKCALTCAFGKQFALRFKDGKRVCAISNAGGGGVVGPQIWDSNMLVNSFSFFSINTKDLLQEPRKLWNYKARVDYTSPVVSNGYVYAMSTAGITGPYTLHCIELASGKQKWEQDGFEMGTSIMLTDGLLFIRSGFKTDADKDISRKVEAIMLVEANPEKYVLKGRFTQEQGDHFGWVMPALAYGRLFVRSQGMLKCFQAAKTAPPREAALKY